MKVMGETLPRLDPNARLGLEWPRWYPLTAQDRLADAQTLSALAGAGLVSRETAIASLADSYDIEDVAAEAERIAADRENTDGNHE